LTAHQRRDLLGVLQCAAVGQAGGDAGGAERVGTTPVLMMPRASLLQFVDGIGQTLLVGLHVPPDVAIAAMAGGLLGVVHAFLFGELSEKRVAVMSSSA